MIIKHAHRYWSFRFSAISTLLASISTYLAMIGNAPRWLVITILTLTIVSGILGAVSRFIKQLSVEEQEG